jgi:folate-binding protein YgfZ
MRAGLMPPPAKPSLCWKQIPESVNYRVSQLVLHEFHQSLGAHFTTLGGAQIVSDYGDAGREYEAIVQSAGVMDLSFRSRLCLTGADRTRFLHGQVTNDVKGLRPGEGCYAALITAKGKMETDLNIFCLADELLLDFEPGLTARIIERLERFVIADDVQIVDVASLYGLLAVNGPKSTDSVQALGIFGELPSKPLNFVSLNDPNLGQIYLAQNARAGSCGYDLFVPTAALSAVADKLVAAARGVGGRACGWEAFELARIEAGIPRFGADMDETNIPLEAMLETRAISFNKGCYIGQEVISRIRTYGQVAKALRGLLLDDSKSLPAKGDRLFKDGKDVGYITSAAASPALKANIALGYVRKEVNEVGSELTARTSAGELRARVAELPFRGS